MSDLSTWKDGEYSYCADLLTTRGNRNVPASSVRSYLELQRSDAKRQGRDDVVKAFDTLLAEWSVLDAHMAAE